MWMFWTTPSMLNIYREHARREVQRLRKALNAQGS